MTSDLRKRNHLPPVKLCYEGPLWASRILPAGNRLHERLSFFGTRTGGIGDGFTRALGYSDTNVMEGGRIASGLSFTVNRLTWEAWGADPDRALLMQFGVLHWEFLNTHIETAVLGASDQLDSADREVIKAVDLVEAADIEEFKTAGCTRGRVAYNDMPILLPANCQFGMKLTLSTGSQADITLSAPVYFRITLHGVAHSTPPIY